MNIQMIDNLLPQLFCIEFNVICSYFVRPLESNWFRYFEHQIRCCQARVAPDLRVNKCRGLNLIQHLLALLFDLQSFCVSALADTKLDATHNIPDKWLPTQATFRGFTSRRCDQ